MELKLSGRPRAGAGVPKQCSRATSDRKPQALNPTALASLFATGTAYFQDLGEVSRAFCREQDSAPLRACQLSVRGLGFGV